ncbi:unnamed protein product [Caretta caretta]
MKEVLRVKREKNEGCGLRTGQAAVEDSSLPSAAPAESAGNPGSAAQGTAVNCCQQTRHSSASRIPG